jgi:hypothetical protein
VSTDGPSSRKGRGRPDPSQGRGWTTAGEITLADGQSVPVTTHCVDRFWERAAAGYVNLTAALERLRLLAEQLGADAPPPDWAGKARCDRYIALGDDVGLLIVDQRRHMSGAWLDQRRRPRLAQPEATPATAQRRPDAITAAESSSTSALIADRLLDGGGEACSVAGFEELAIVGDQVALVGDPRHRPVGRDDVAA